MSDENASLTKVKIDLPLFSFKTLDEEEIKSHEALDNIASEFYGRVILHDDGFIIVEFYGENHEMNAASYLKTIYNFRKK